MNRMKVIEVALLIRLPKSIAPSQRQESLTQREDLRESLIIKLVKTGMR
jgi:hypothetical protein